MLFGQYCQYVVFFFKKNKLALFENIVGKKTQLEKVLMKYISWFGIYC